MANERSFADGYARTLLCDASVAGRGHGAPNREALLLIPRVTMVWLDDGGRLRRRFLRCGYCNYILRPTTHSFA
jgi:hypothetical protein